jgi:tetratricopeptide (TPR) repeat protein
VILLAIPQAVHSVEVLLNELRPIHNDRSREFEIQCTDFAGKLSKDDVQTLKEWLQARQGQGNDDPYVFAVFVVICTFYRRKKDLSLFREIMGQSGRFFRSYPLYPHLQSLLKKEEGNIEESIQHAKTAVALLPDQVGVIHNYAEAIIHGKEQNLDITTEELRKAKDFVNQAIQYTPDYAKFYCTRGRILAALGDFKGAKASILEAIDQEKSEKGDYAIRISDYQYHLINVQSNELYLRIERKIAATETGIQSQKEEIEGSLRNIKSENLQMLGFFVAIISFTMGSFSLAKGRPFFESGLLVLILTGCMILAYVGFGVLFQLNKEKDKKIIWVSIIAALLVIGSFAGYHFLK